MSSLFSSEIVDRLTLVYQVHVKFYPFASNDKKHLIGVYDSYDLANRVYCEAKKRFGDKIANGIDLCCEPYFATMIETPMGRRIAQDPNDDRMTPLETGFNQEAISTLIERLVEEENRSSLRLKIASNWWSCQNSRRDSKRIE